MATILPSLVSATNIKYGIPELYAARPDLFSETTQENRFGIGVVDAGFNHAGNFRMWVNPEEIAGDGIDNDLSGRIDDIEGWNFSTNSNVLTDSDSHANSVVSALVAPCPENIALADIDMGSSHFMSLDGLKWSANRPTIRAANLSYELTSALGITSALDDLHANETFGLFPPIGQLEVRIDETLYPYNITTAAVNISNDTQNNSNAGNSVTTTLFGAYASLISFSCPVAGSVLALLNRADPTLTANDLKNLLISGCIQNATTESYLKYGIINHKRSYEALMGSLTSTQFFFPNSPGEALPETSEGPFPADQSTPLNPSTVGELANMAITYPRNTDAKYVLYKISTSEALKRNVDYPRADGGEIEGMDPDLIYLEQVTTAAPDYDPRYFVRVVTETPDLDVGQYQIVNTVEKRPVVEIEQVVENIETEANQQVIPYEKQLKYLLLGVGLALHQIDGQSLTQKQAALRSLIISKAVKLWKNDDTANQLKTLIQGGSEPDLDTAPWEKD